MTIPAKQCGSLYTECDILGQKNNDNFSSGATLSLLGSSLICLNFLTLQINSATNQETSNIEKQADSLVIFALLQCYREIETPVELLTLFRGESQFLCERRSYTQTPEKVDGEKIFSTGSVLSFHSLWSLSQHVFLLFIYDFTHLFFGMLHDFFRSRLWLTMLFDSKAFVIIFKWSADTDLINISYLDQVEI